jgi:hypothetical protein
VVRGNGPSLEIRIPVGQGIVGRVAQTGSRIDDPKNVANVQPRSSSSDLERFFDSIFVV